MSQVETIRKEQQVGRTISVLVLSSTNTARHLTWKLRVELMLPHLREQGFRVECFNISKSKDERKKLFAELGGFDIVWLHRVTFSAEELNCVRQMGTHLVLDIDDPVGLSAKRFLNISYSKRVRFQATAKAASLVIAASDGLVDFVKLYNKNIAYIPLCADLAEHSLTVRPRVIDEPFRLLWLGGRSTFIYLRQIRKHLEAIGRECKNVELLVVGHEKLELKNMQVHNRQWSPDAEVDALNCCHVGLVPMSNNRWTRAKAALKPLQYMANGMPFVGPPVGVLNRLALDGQVGLLASNPQEWVQAVQRLQADEQTRQAMGVAGIEYVKRYHAAEMLAPQVECAFREMIEAESSAPSHMARLSNVH